MFRSSPASSWLLACRSTFSLQGKQNFVSWQKALFHSSLGAENLWLSVFSVFHLRNCHIGLAVGSCCFWELQFCLPLVHLWCLFFLGLVHAHVRICLPHNVSPPLSRCAALTYDCQIVQSTPPMSVYVVSPFPCVLCQIPATFPCVFPLLREYDTKFEPFCDLDSCMSFSVSWLHKSVLATDFEAAYQLLYLRWSCSIGYQTWPVT